MPEVNLAFFATNFNTRRQKVVVTDTEYTEGYIIKVGEPSKTCIVNVLSGISGVINAAKPDLVVTQEYNEEAEKWAGLVGASYTWLEDNLEADLEENLEENLEDQADFDDLAEHLFGEQYGSPEEDFE